MAKKTQSDQITILTREFLSHIGFSDDVSVSTTHDPAADLYQVNLQTTNPSLLIGYHGDTLSSLQLLLGLHLHQQTDQWLNLSVNVNDYRERRQQSLQAMADTVVDQVLTTGQPHSLPPLPSNERRLIHLYLSEHPQVATSSLGEGRSRSVVISPK